MRRVVVLFLMATVLALVPSPASARCSVMPLDEAVDRADAVWWGTVTEAVASPEGPGLWTLTVRIHDALKGQERPGDTGRFFQASCGLLELAPYAKELASQFVGDQRLFIGTYEGGGLKAMSDFFEPQVSPRQQYRLASEEFLPRKVLPPHTGALPRWLWWLVAAVVVLVVLGVYSAVRRRSSASAS